MDLNSHVSRRTALEYLLALLASAVGSRAFAEEKLGLAPSPRPADAFAPALAGRVKPQIGATLEPRVTPVAFTRVPSNFKCIYSDQKLSDHFYLFLQNVYHLYPENQFHQLILDLTAEYGTDEEIYQKLLERLPEIKPPLGMVTYGLPSLSKQKEEMARQTAELLDTSRSLNGYIEIGTTGRYFNGIQERVSIAGPVYIVNDQAPAYSPEDIFERGQLTQIGTYVPMGNYEPFAGQYVPPESVELVTNFIGFHHAPADKLDGFVQSIWNVLKPGGQLVVRDHDVDDQAMDALVGLAHDVFNAGLGISWESNHAQIRNFRSIAQLEGYLEKVGFERSGKLLLQDHDPTRNALVVFIKPRARTV